MCEIMCNTSVYRVMLCIKINDMCVILLYVNLVVYICMCTHVSVYVHVCV